MIRHFALAIAALAVSAQAHAYHGNCEVHYEQTGRRDADVAAFDFSIPSEQTVLDVPAIVRGERLTLRFNNFFYPGRHPSHPNGLLQLTIHRQFVSQDGLRNEWKVIYAGDLATAGRTRGRVLLEDHIDGGTFVYDCNVGF